MGVSKSTPTVARSVATALQNFYDIEELLDAFSAEVAEKFRVEAATLTHCTAASISLAVAGVMCRRDASLVKKLPETAIPPVILIQRPHVIDYGHSIAQSVRLPGARLRIVGDETGCGEEQLAAACDAEHVQGLVLVESRLVQANAVDQARAVQIARRRGIPTILDAAAQDLRIAEILRYGADLNLFSIQKYLAGPTAGLVMGPRDLLSSVRAQFKGIGRGMKPSKEAILGSLSAIRERKDWSVASWTQRIMEKNRMLISMLKEATGIVPTIVEDRTGAPVSRVHLDFGPTGDASIAGEIVRALKDGSPSIHVFEDRIADNEIAVELVMLGDREISIIASRIVEETARALSQ